MDIQSSKNQTAYFKRTCGEIRDKSLTDKETGTAEKDKGFWDNNSKMNKQSFVAFIDSNLKSLFESLEKGKFEDKKLYSFISRAIEDLKLNPSCGIKISKHL